MSQATQDPTAAKAHSQSSGLTPQQKIDGLLELTKSVSVAMLTSRAPDGKLASRAMSPATTEGFVFSFYQNLESGKTNDIETDPNVNISFIDAKTGDWASISGKAHINKDKSKVKRHWHTALQAWFDDKKDGVHTGDEDDPRVVMIDVVPEEIRYYSQTGTFAFLKETAKAAMSGHVAAPGKLVILDSDEIALATRVHSKN